MLYAKYSRSLFVASVATTLAAVVSAATPPVARVTDTSDTIHGVVVKDPYRYFENSKSPEVQTWLKAQGAVTRETLDKIALRERIASRITEITDATGDAIREVVRMPGERLYYLKRVKGGKQYKLVTRTGVSGVERVLVDPEEDARRTGIPHALNYFEPSWDGRYVAYGMSAGGSEDASMYLLDIKTGKTVGQPIPRVYGEVVNWLPDSRSLTYNQTRKLAPGEAESETFLDTKVMWLKVGEPEAKAKAVFGPTVTKNLGLNRLDVATVFFSPDSKWMIARTTDTTLPEGFLFVAPVAQLGKATIKWKKISGYSDHITAAQLRGNELYLMTRLNTPRHKVIKLDLRTADLKRAVDVAVPPVDSVLERFQLTRDGVIGSVRVGTDIVLRRYATGNVEGEAIAMPFKGAAYVVVEPAHSANDVLYTSSEWTRPSRVFALSGATSTQVSLVAPVTSPGLPEIEVVDVKVASHDGAMVPMTLLFKKGLKRDGTNPTLLNAYAGYGFSQTARFSPADMVWIEQGGVLAIANVRGSGVYGDDWYRAGQKSTKANTWKDGVACAKWLIAEGYASPKTLGAMGTSAGGIFVGRTVTSAPEIFAAAIFNVGVMDAVRAEESANGITNISEFGSYKNAAEFPALLDMSTYHNIKDNTAYPAVMLVHGMNDPRVDVWHSAKTTARLQAATTSGKPILLRLDLQAGHGVGSTVNQRSAQAADIFSFLLWQMGKTQLK